MLLLQGISKTGDFSADKIVLDKDNQPQNSRQAPDFVSKIKNLGKNLSIASVQKSKNIESKIQPEVYSAPSEEVNVIVEVGNEDNSLQSIAEGNVKSFNQKKFKSIKIRKDKLAQLEQSSSVKRVWIDNLNKASLHYIVPLIGANSIWNNSYNSSIDSKCIC